MNIMVTVIIMLAGLVGFILPTPPKWNEASKWMFIVGLFFTVWTLAGTALRIH